MHTPVGILSCNRLYISLSHLSSDLVVTKLHHHVMRESEQSHPKFCPSRAARFPTRLGDEIGPTRHTYFFLLHTIDHLFFNSILFNMTAKITLGLTGEKHVFTLFNPMIKITLGTVGREIGVRKSVHSLVNIMVLQVFSRGVRPIELNFPGINTP